MKHELIISSPADLSSAIGRMRATLKKKGAFRLKIDTSKSRSLNQNALLHQFCSIVALERGEESMMEVKRFVKLHIFAPLLCASSDEFAEALELMCRGLSEDEQLKAIHHVDVTSACSTAQMARGLEDMVNYYAGLGVDPVILDFPDER